MKPSEIAKLKKEQLKLKYSPQRGVAFIAYKKVKDVKGERSFILTLLVPATADRTVGARNQKIRFSEVKVLSAETVRGEKTTLKTFQSLWDHSYRYRVGEWHRPVRPYKRNTDVCESGIHGYLSKGKAQRH